MNGARITPRQTPPSKTKGASGERFTSACSEMFIHHMRQKPQRRSEHADVNLFSGALLLSTSDSRSFTTPQETSRQVFDLYALPKRQKTYAQPPLLSSTTGKGQDRSYAFISESEIGPGLLLRNTKMAENIPPTLSALEYQRGSQSRSYAKIKPDLLNAKKVENIPLCSRVLQENSDSILSPLPKLGPTTIRPKRAENRLPSTLEVQQKNMSRTDKTYPSMSEIEPGLFLGIPGAVTAGPYSKQMALTQ
jgi:hypothetical protein